MPLTFSSTAITMASWTTSTTTAGSRSTMPRSSRRQSIGWTRHIPSSSGGQASIQPRPGMDLSFTSIRAATALAGRGPQEADVEHRRTSDVTIEQEPIVADQKTEHKENGKRAEPDEAKPIKEIRASDIEPYTGLRYLS